MGDFTKAKTLLPKQKGTKDLISQFKISSKGGCRWLSLSVEGIVIIHMQGSRGETIQREGYLAGSRPQEQELQTIQQQPREPQSLGKYYETRQEEQPQQLVKQEEETWGGYLLHWVCAIIALAINVGVWAINYYAVGRQNSTYYKNSYTVSPYIDTVSYASSTSMFTSDPTDTLGTAMGLLYGWVLWKAPLVIWVLHLTHNQPSKGLRIGSWAAFVVLLLAADILLTIFALSFYADWIFFGIYVILGLIVVLVNEGGLGRAGQGALNSLVPWLLIALLYCIYSLFLPSLYHIYTTNLSSTTAVFLVIYIYPGFDLIIYSLCLGLGTKLEPSLKGGFSMIHFLMIGYGAGMVLNCGYTEVEFYYLIGYFIFRNVFVNHIMRRWEVVVSNPPALPAWGIAYYLGYALSFIPVIGVGKLVISKSFMSYIYALTPPPLYGSSNPLYPSSTAPTVSLTTNVTMGGKMFWLGGLLIWLAMTFSQRYSKRWPLPYDFFYYLLGIQLFFLGLGCSLSNATLTVSGSL